jgi:SAM-dependent methyltransferase
VNSIKQKIVKILRDIHLLRLADYLRFVYTQRKYRHENKVFIDNNPGFRLPPPDLAYDAYAHTRWSEYYRNGKEHAQYISGLINKHVVKNPICICEWGCGPARLLRHMEELFPGRSVELFGFDYNIRTIEWCRDNIPNITFLSNSLLPPLPCESNSFDCLYCLSVFTHLSRDLHFQWIDELSRVVKPDGYIILTTHGDLNRSNLMKNESQLYDKGELVVRGNVIEGKRFFVSYHPPSFVKNELLKKLELVSHYTNPIPGSLTQDVWIVKNSKINYKSS